MDDLRFRRIVLPKSFLRWVCREQTPTDEIYSSFIPTKETREDNLAGHTLGRSHRCILSMVVQTPSVGAFEVWKAAFFYTDFYQPTTVCTVLLPVLHPSEPRGLDCRIYFTVYVHYQRG